jgi:hypothetical protein
MTQEQSTEHQGRGLRRALVVTAIVLGGLYIVGTAAGGGGDQAFAGGQDGGSKQESAATEQYTPPATQAAERTPEEKPEPRPDKKKQKKPKVEMHAVGESAQAGKMTWTLTNAYETNALEDPRGLERPKQGHFVVVDFNFTNGANESVTLDDTMHITLKDSQGRKFSTDNEQWLYIPMRKDIFLKEVNPGVTQKGRVIFTVAPDASGFIC